VAGRNLEPDEEGELERRARSGAKRRGAQALLPRLAPAARIEPAVLAGAAPSSQEQRDAPRRGHRHRVQPEPRDAPERGHRHCVRPGGRGGGRSEAALRQRQVGRRRGDEARVARALKVNGSNG
ncbi:hypothetical protein T484DRAFT_1881329, partial [Baffinella frigidus]